MTEEDEAWLREQDAAEAQECFEKHRIHDVHDDESHISLPNWLRKQQQNIIKQHSSSILFNTTHIHTLQLIPFFPRARQLLQLRGNGLCTSAVSGDCGRKNLPQTSIDFQDLPRNTRNCQGDSTLRQFLPLSFERLILSPNSNCLSRSASSSGKADEGSFDMVPG